VKLINNDKQSKANKQNKTKANWHAEQAPKDRGGCNKGGWFWCVPKGDLTTGFLEGTSKQNMAFHCLCATSKV
jgi:hypothetical protein